VNHALRHGPDLNQNHGETKNSENSEDKMGQHDAFKNYIGMSWAMKKPTLL